MHVEVLKLIQKMLKTNIILRNSCVRAVELCKGTELLWRRFSFNEQA